MIVEKLLIPLFNVVAAVWLYGWLFGDTDMTSAMFGVLWLSYRAWDLGIVGGAYNTLEGE